jgi:hypothetical protein
MARHPGKAILEDIARRLPGLAEEFRFVPSLIQPEFDSSDACEEARHP